MKTGMDPSLWVKRGGYFPLNLTILPPDAYRRVGAFLICACQIMKQLGYTPRSLPGL